MHHIDDIASACHASLTPACSKLLFDIADENKNGKISPKELKNAATMLASLAAVAKDILPAVPTWTKPSTKACAKLTALARNLAGVR